LCALSDDHFNQTYLSPGYFVIGEPLTQLPAADITNVKNNILSRWQTYQNNCINSGSVGNQITPDSATASTLAEEIL
jgi:hypothetical protein